MVTDAVVLAKEKTNGETYLVVYVAGDPELREDRLGAYLAEQLPSYMVLGFLHKSACIACYAQWQTGYQSPATARRCA